MTRIKSELDSYIVPIMSRSLKRQAGKNVISQVVLVFHSRVSVFLFLTL